MSNEFDPVLKAQLSARRKERLREARVAQDKLKLQEYLRQRGLRDISQDPSLKRVKSNE